MFKLLQTYEENTQIARTLLHTLYFPVYIQYKSSINMVAADTHKGYVRRGVASQIMMPKKIGWDFSCDNVLQGVDGSFFKLRYRITITKRVN